MGKIVDRRASSRESPVSVVLMPRLHAFGQALEVDSIVLPRSLLRRILDLSTNCECNEAFPPSSSLMGNAAHATRANLYHSKFFRTTNARKSQHESSAAA